MLARRAHYSASTLAAAAKGERLPSLEVLLAYAQACGAERAEWELRWRAAAAAAEQHQGGHEGDRDEPCPFPGLAVFEAEDAEVFHGRSELTKKLLDEIARQPVTVVFGASGSGKSSLLRAGLIAGLGENWHTVLLTPGQRPLAETAAAVAPLIDADTAQLREQLVKDPRALELAVRTWLAGQSDDTRVLLIVDQFEETYTLDPPEGERDAYLQALADLGRTADSRTRLAIGVRADFYPRCLTHPDLAAALCSAAHLPVGPPTRDELAEIITAPATRAGVSVDADLLQVVLGEAAGQPGALPLVAHALREAWSRREGAVLRLADYRATGGMRGAVAQTCERMFHEATENQQQILKAVFLRLTALGEGTEDTRRRLPRTELDGLAETDEIDALLQRLAAARVLVLAQDTVEVAHEAVIRAWPRLRRWLDDDREAIRTHHRLTTAAQTWHDLNRDHAALYRGSQLTTAQTWAKEHGHTLNTLEKAFLHGGIRAERRRAHLARSVTATLATLLVLALIAAGSAYQQRNHAVTAQKTAQSRQLAAQSATLMDTDPDLASLLAVQAYRTSPTTEAATSLDTAAFRPLRTTLTGRHAKYAYMMVFSPDGRTLATGEVARPLATGEDGTVRLWDVATGKIRRTLTLNDPGFIPPVAFSPDGRTLATVSGGETVRLWDVATGDVRRTFPSHTDVVFTVAFSPDGRILATGGQDGTVRLLNVATGDVRRTLIGHTDRVGAMEFSPDGRTLATGSLDGTVRLWDVASGESRRTLTAHFTEVVAVAFSPDGRNLATGSADGTVRLWDVASGESRRTLIGHTDRVGAMTFSFDGRTLATGSRDKTVRFWDVATGEVHRTLTGYIDPAAVVAFSPDGSTLATSRSDGTMRLWDTTRSGARRTLTGHTSRLIAVAFSPDSRTLATGSFDGTVRLWDVATGDVRRTFTGHTDHVGAVAFSPDGRTLATGSQDGTVRLWDVASGKSRRTLTAHFTEVVAVAFSPDGSALATGGSDDDTARLWDVATGDVRRTFTGHTGVVFTVAFSPDGRTLATGSDDETLRLWDVATGDVRRTLTGHTGFVSTAAFSPHGRTLATGGEDKTVRLWDVNLSTPAETIRHVCQAVHRDFTAEERSLYLPGRELSPVCP